jgi:hypothetical protein
MVGFIAELDTHAGAVAAGTFDGWQAKEAIDDVFGHVDISLSPCIEWTNPVQTWTGFT